MILTQEDTFWFKIFEEENMKANKYKNTRQSWIKLSGKFEPTTGASNNRLLKKFAKGELDYVSRNYK